MLTEPLLPSLTHACIRACAALSLRSLDYTSQKALRWAGPIRPQGRDAVLEGDTEPLTSFLY